MSGSKEEPQALFVVPKDAAVLLGVSHVSVRRWVANGAIPSVKINNKRLIPKQWINDFVARAYEGDASQPEREDNPDGRA